MVLSINQICYFALLFSFLTNSWVRAADFYNVGVSIALSGEKAACTDAEEALLETIGPDALDMAGFAVGNSGKWKVFDPADSNGNGGNNGNGGDYNGNGGDKGKKEGWKRNDFSDFGWDRRQLQNSCDYTCYFFCYSTGQDRWCSCCSCCTQSARRMLRIQSDRRAEDIQELAKQHSMELLESHKGELSCLAQPFDVDITIEKV